MSVNNSERAEWPNQLKATMTGADVLIGTLTKKPVLMFMNNLGTVAIDIAVNDPTVTNVWMTFAPGQAIAIDMRDKAHLASNFGADIGTSYYGNGASGDFAISYISALDT